MANYPNYIVRKTFHIHHQKWVSWKVQHFPIHQKKLCQLYWQKHVFFEKIGSVLEKLNSLCSVVFAFWEIIHLRHTQKIQTMFANKLYTHIKGHILFSHWICSGSQQLYYLCFELTHSCLLTVNTFLLFFFSSIFKIFLSNFLFEINNYFL